MSIYRDDIHNDLHAIKTIKQKPDQKRDRTQESVDQEEYKHLRKAAPATALLPPTLTWAENLPSGVRPAALLSHYPRIANFIAAAWGDARAFHAYMDSLLTDKRGNRRGFPRDVLRELVVLALQHSQYTLKGEATRRDPPSP